ncbi:MAG: leucine-rich repeat protein, partial [Clostridiales bacterium]|nr:leucine-rich repeat protein [Clostridiales bacterium]
MKKIWKRTLAMLLVVLMVGGIAPIDALANVEWPTLPVSGVFTWAADAFNDGMRIVRNVTRWLSDKVQGLSFPAAAADYTSGSYTYSLSDNTATITKCDLSVSGSISIPGKLDGFTVVAIGSSAFEKCNLITGITIPDSVKKIDNYAFNGCTALTSVELGKVETLGYCLFLDCTNLKKLSIPNTVTSSYSRNGYETLYGVYQYYYNQGALSGSYITDLVFEDGIKKIPESICSQCKTLENVRLPGAKPFTEVEPIIPEDAVAFNGHYYKAYNLPMTWEDAERNCEGVGGYLITIASKEENDFAFNLIKQESQDYYWLGATDNAFEDDWHWITDEEWNYTAWSNCFDNGWGGKEDYAALLRIDSWGEPGQWNDFVNDAQGSSSTEFGYICEWGNYSDDGEEYSFYTGGLEIGNHAFYGCESINIIALPKNVTVIEEYAFSDCTSLVSVKAQDGTTNLKSIGNYAYRGCTTLTSVELGKVET